MPDSQPSLEQSLASSYRLERELGRGGMAVVYLAHDVKHDRKVALKVIRPDMAWVGVAERFSREIKLAARLQHPHILPVHDSGEAAGQLWYTMPFVEGESLRDRLDREGKLAMADAIRIAREAAQALAYAHQHSVIHRDIKPENLLLTSDGSVLVADFGIARAIAQSTAASSTSQLTETGIAVGTPAYMAPETRLGAPADAKSDIYSLASVLYEMLTGKMLSPAGGFGSALFMADSVGESGTNWFHIKVSGGRRL
jgi:serine/threonine protein kinase